MIELQTNVAKKEKEKPKQLLTKELGLGDGVELNEVVKNAGEHGVRAIAQVFVEHRGLY